ncbi:MULTISPECIES: membrane integrity-associated transporter subunit PqiA [Proteus]|uniref:Paraquat-inducible membrane protein A n=2 Tax=Enterobacterales TaxID=91347 RepID=A0A379F534_PROVU|nr:membrane integrity-associated transporter subunit PqiA [Proteus vulgaris]MBI6510453.1 membrane integrity-associated transporter subunit PqiA [Proteus sp. PR00174]NBN47588.1 membrane integrity-associated transporter subunit PqiA [Proteus sp. G2626]NBN61520.1 membrane integrity-associated transporter subunit PqiA [Proteus sp. G2639]NBN75512.1 membrane integrity-associated transporter subunit PqiA [Proteus sp. G2615]NBN87332.1 membrane integrity-associated transporter subunit PqiA [Proteus sp.
MCSGQQHRHEHKHKQILCPQCDLVVSVPELVQGTKATCPRCHTMLIARWRQPFYQPVALAISALFMLLMASQFTFVSMEVAGIANNVTLMQIPSVMFSENYIELGAFFLLFVQIVPAFCMVAILLLCTPIKLPRKLQIWLSRILFQLKSWCMAEIFLAGILVSFVKLMAYGEIGLGLSFLPYVLYCLFQIRAFQCLDRHTLWEKLEPRPDYPNIESGKSGLKQGVRLCRSCTAILPVTQYECSRCEVKGHARRPKSLQWTVSLLITSLILYIPANLLPIMVTESLGNNIYSTIMAGVILLWEDGSYPVAMVIFIASIMVPSLKMVAIAWLCWDAHKSKGKRDPAKMHFLYEVVEYVGRWSMIDVFVIAVLASLVRMGRLMSIYPDFGVVLFAVVVVLTMFSAMMFDPRLTWDKCTADDDKSKIKEPKGD